MQRDTVSRKANVGTVGKNGLRGISNWPLLMSRTSWATDEKIPVSAFIKAPKLGKNSDPRTAHLNKSNCSRRAAKRGGEGSRLTRGKGGKGSKRGEEEGEATQLPLTTRLPTVPRNNRKESHKTDST